MPISTTSWIASPSSGSSSGSKPSSSLGLLDGLGLDLLEQVLAQLGLALARPEARERLDLRLVDVGALDALQPRGADRREEHVALAEQRLGAVLVEDHARVGLRADREGDPRRDVGLDHARDDVDARGLRREHEVDADRARLLGQADDRVLDVGGRDHHQVGELVDDAQDVGQRLVALARRAAC